MRVTSYKLEQITIGWKIEDCILSECFYASINHSNK